MERVFSSCGNIMSDKRTSLQRERFQKIVMIKKNWTNLLYKISARQKAEEKEQQEIAAKTRAASAPRGARKRALATIASNVHHFFAKKADQQKEK